MTKAITITARGNKALVKPTAAEPRDNGMYACSVYVLEIDTDIAPVGVQRMNSRNVKRVLFSAWCWKSAAKKLRKMVLDAMRVESEFNCGRA